MILLWGLPGDRPLALVAAALERLAEEVHFFDQRASPGAEAALSVDGAVGGRLAWNGRDVDLSTVSAAYIRPYDSRRLPAVTRAGPDSLLWRHVLSLEDILTSWTEITPALVVNQPSAMASNSSKPYQLSLIRSVGFNVPETLITTDPARAVEFWEQHGEVVYKSLSGVRSVVSRLTPGHLSRIQDVIWCPTQFQAYVPGTDYRVHVVGEEIFACRIISDRDDYRYAFVQGGSSTIEAYDLDVEVAETCRKLVKVLGLLVAGVDLRRTPDGRWFCFEVNPSPGFSYYQDATDQPIDAAIARLLSRGANDGMRRKE